MRRVRVIPVLLIQGPGLVKSKRFRNFQYVGDPINAVKIFNDKEVDELAIIDISASRENRAPNIQKIAEIATEAFMPVSYGGGITTTDQVRHVLFNGIEKVILNKSAAENPKLISAIANMFGSQSVVVSIDYKKNLFGKYGVYVDNGATRITSDVVEYARKSEELGAGEIFLNSIERDGMYSGYDIDMIRKVSEKVSIPVIACGGASSIKDFKFAYLNGASAVAAGSMFVFQRPHNAVLISYPSQLELQREFYSRI